MIDSVMKDAIYRDTGVKRYQGNRLIEALPPIFSPSEMENLLKWEPEVPTDEDLIKPEYLRVHEVPELRKLVYPLPEYTLYQSIFSVAIRDGYTKRDPIKPETQRHLYYINTGKAPEPNDLMASGLLFSGVSGMGKSTFFNRMLNLYPQAIQHTRYYDSDWRNVQVVYIKVNCPDNGSISDLIFRIFKEIDRVAGTGLVVQYFSDKYRKTKREVLLQALRSVAINYFIGVLIIDELQRLNRAKTQGDEGMLEFLSDLVDEIGIPVICIGTPSVTNLFQHQLKSARRGASMGYYEFVRPKPNDNAWSDLVETVWKYQWTNKKTGLSAKIKNALYEHTQGITALLIAMFTLAQYRCLVENFVLCPELFADISKTELAPVQQALRVLRCPDTKAAKEFDDLWPGPGWLEAVTSVESAVARAAQPKADGEKTTGSRARKGLPDKAPAKGKSTPSSDPKDLRNLPNDPTRAQKELFEQGLTPGNIFDLKISKSDMSKGGGKAKC